MEQAEQILIARTGVPVMLLAGVESETRLAARPLGIDRGRVKIHESLDDPLVEPGLDEDPDDPLTRE